MEESLILVNWSVGSEIRDDALSNILELDYNEANDEVILIDIQGVGDVISEFINQSGYDVFNEKDFELFKTHIKSELDPKYGVKDLKKSLHWKRPTAGYFIVVMKINGFQSNHPLDPEEWDVDVKCLGILGREIKLVA